MQENWWVMNKRLTPVHGLQKCKMVTTQKWTTSKKIIFLHPAAGSQGPIILRIYCVIPLQYKKLTVNRLTEVNSRLTRLHSRLNEVSKIATKKECNFNS